MPPLALPVEVSSFCAAAGAHFLRVKVVCSASCFQLASEGQVKLITSKPYSEPPVPLSDQL